MSDEEGRSRKRKQNPTPEAIRERNAMYSRRLYHRRKEQLEALQEQTDILRREQEALLREGQRLEVLASQVLGLIVQISAATTSTALAPTQLQQNAHLHGGALLPPLLGNATIVPPTVPLPLQPQPHWQQRQAALASPVASVPNYAATTAALRSLLLEAHLRGQNMR